MPDQSDRRAENEAVFRAANENLERVAARAGRPEGTFLCECYRADCLETLTLSHDDYLCVREEPHHFVLVSGHENAPDEDVIARRNGFVVVAKTGSGGDVARRLA